MLWASYAAIYCNQWKPSMMKSVNSIELDVEKPADEIENRWAMWGWMKSSQHKTFPRSEQQRGTGNSWLQYIQLHVEEPIGGYNLIASSFNRDHLNIAKKASEKRRFAESYGSDTYFGTEVFWLTADTSFGTRAFKLHSACHKSFEFI